MTRKQNFLENLIYALIWIVVLVLPIYNFKNADEGVWVHVFFFWNKVLPLFILFLINNYILVPYFLFRDKKGLYFTLVGVTVVLLFVFKPILLGVDGPPPGMLQNMPPHSGMKNMPMPPPNGGPFFRLPLVGMIINNCLVAVLIVGFNLAIRFLFKSIRDERHLKELESHTLQTELNYLKAQVNPHFFMNTLNNIHALIDIDTEKAKETVIELSKIMRYVLYEAEQALVPVSKELNFLENYIALMRIRYTEGVDIDIKFPATVPDGKIPPLLLITLIENAFKHGISYKQNSYIRSEMSVKNNRLTYKVENSISQEDATFSSGVGMENLRKRLSLLFGEDYMLEISNNGQTYTAILNIPIQ